MAFISQVEKDGIYISSWKHSKSIPKLLETISLEEFELILNLAVESLKSLREATTSHQYDEILQKKILEIKTQCDDRIHHIITTSTSELQRTKEQQQQENEILQKRIIDIKTQCESKIQHIIHTTTNELQQQKDRQQQDIQNKTKKIQEIESLLENSTKANTLLQQNFLNITNQSIEKNISSSFEKQNAMISVLDKSHKSQIEHLEKLYKEQIQQLQISVDKYTKQAATITANSTVKGKTGESNFDTLVQANTTWELHNTSSLAQSCDRMATIRDCKTLFEVKNYSTSVPKKEIDKFCRDLEVHKDCPVGVFISLNTNIVGAPQEFFYSTYTSSGQLLIFIQRFLQQDIPSIFTIIDTCIDLGYILYKKSIKCDDEDDPMQSKIDSVKTILLTEISASAKLITELETNKKFITATITKHHSSIKHSIEKMKYTFESIIKILFEDQEVEDINESPIKKKRAS